jgi:hypothetical protein
VKTHLKEIKDLNIKKNKIYLIINKKNKNKKHFANKLIISLQEIQTETSQRTFRERNNSF